MGEMFGNYVAPKTGVVSKISRLILFLCISPEKSNTSNHVVHSMRLEAHRKDVTIKRSTVICDIGVLDTLTYSFARAP